MQTLLERENEQLTDVNVKLQTSNTAQSERISDLESQIENVSAVGNTLQAEKMDLQGQVIAADGETDRLRSELKAQRAESLQWQRRFRANETAAADGRTALAYAKENYISKYERYHDLPDMPMTAKDKLELSETVSGMTLDDIITADRKLGKDVMKHGLRSNGGRQSGEPTGYTGTAV